MAVAVTCDVCDMPCCSCIVHVSQVVVDDLLPVDANGRLLCSASSTPGELWVSIIEKAYMKVNGKSAAHRIIAHQRLVCCLVLQLVST